MKILVSVILFSISAELYSASDVYRCTDANANGNVIYDQKPCGPDAVVETLEDSYIGEKQNTRSRSAIEQLENYRRSVRETEKITGSRKESTKRKTDNDPCASIISLTLRNARISNDVMKCHTMEDVRSIYGDPKSVSTWSDRSAYDTRWKYWSREEGARYIYFKYGRVTKWSTHNKKQ